MNKIFTLILTLIFSNSIIYCQKDINEPHLNSLELGLSNFMVIDSHHDLHFATDIHIIKPIYKKLGIGIGFASIFENHISNEIITFINYKPTTNLLFNVGPNFILPNAEHEFTVATHFETEYLFTLYKEFKIGPTIEVDFGKINHFGAGLHLALDL